MRVFPCLLVVALALSGVLMNAQVNLLEDVPLGTDVAPFPAVTSAQAPTARWASTSSPLPTNVWWQNLVLNDGTNVANAFPYVVKCSADGLSASMPGITVGETFVFSTFIPNWTLGSIENLNAHQVNGWDPLSVNVGWDASSAGGSLQAPIVRGMPYLTVQYTNLTPEFTTVHALLSVNGASVSVTHTDSRFELALNNGQTWVLYTSSPISLSGAAGGLTATGPFTGVARMALLSGNGAVVNESLLDAHADVYPLGGQVDAVATGDVAVLTFDWNLASMSGATPTTVLQCALPHHLPVLEEVPEASTSYPTIKGPMQAVVAGSWHMDEALTTIGFEAPGGIAPSLEQDVRDALYADTDFAITAADTYFGGKQLAAVGRLAVIADELEETTLAANYRSALGNALHPWLQGTNSDPLRYDQTWGGVISNSGGSFDMGLYNDHHFHYGYFLYAAAAMAKDNPAWQAEWDDEVMHLVRNLANPAPSDPHYTYLRNKDWFVGHSWASGLFEFGDGRNQESTSEAVNAWYSLYLYGLATGKDRVRDLGRLMLTTEIRSTQRYWQVDSGDGIYQEPYASNKCVGVLWSTKVDYTTFFGANIEFIHGIQVLPFTPISEQLLEEAWIQEEYPVLEVALDSPDIGEGWKGFVYMAHAVIDPGAAWTEVNTLTGYDDGNTETNTLYWLATRPGIEEAVGGGTGGGGGGTDPEGVLFRVDMSQEVVNGTVYITGGTIDGWCGNCTAMSDADGDGVWEVLLDLAAGPVEYKFTNGGWDDGEVFDPVEDASCTLTTDIFTNRYFVVPASGNATLDVVCFNSCDACPAAPCASDTNGNGICDEDDVPGCTYPLAPNYDPLATMDNGTCIWTPTAACPEDVNADGDIGVSDLLQVLGAFGTECL